jgi:bla regulator protein BlaR1
MISDYLSTMWAAIAPSLGNHLWQSTIFATAAGLFTLFLRKNHARARYWLWLAASVKFLIPLSLLVAIGSHLPWPRGSAGMNATLYVAIEQVSQPFTQSTMPVVSPLTPVRVSQSMTHLLPVLFIAAWLCGFVMVLCLWCVRWSRISRAIREAVPLREGREVEALRRIESITGMQQRIELLSSRASLEPGIFGIAQPVLVWPEGISERLDDAHLEGILAHELWHVRRRDNLFATMHMVVEAIFWFHPLVWWLGVRLVEERERACDEEVLESGSDRHVYAESILKICEFCVESPLDCVTGVTGADLKKRIVRIMTEGVSRRLDFRRKLMLGAAGLVAVAAPIVFGLVNGTASRAGSQPQTKGANAPVFEVASIKLNKSDNGLFKMMFEQDGFSATSVTMRMLIRTAYEVSDNQIFGVPNWLNSEKYDIEAKMDSSVADGLRKISEDQRRVEKRRMLQALLADRFKLTLHRETKQLGVYALVIAKNGPKLKEAKPGDTYPNGFKEDGRPLGAGVFKLGRYAGGRGELIGQGLPMPTLVRLLSENILNRGVLDNTGLTGSYDFALQWTIADESQGPMFKGAGDDQQGTGSTTPPDSSGPSLFTAIQEQLGLKLESQKGAGGVLVIDHVEKPSEN